MTAAFLTDAIRVEVVTVGGVARDIVLTPGGASQAARAFIGRPAAETAALAGGLFALGPWPQGAAAACATAAATGAPDAATPRRVIRLTAERIGENLRSSVLSWPLAEDAVGPDPATLTALRQALAALRALGAGAPDPRGQLDILGGAAQALGLAPGGAPAQGWFGRMRREAEADGAYFPGGDDARRLTAADDADVFELMARGAAIEPTGGLGAPRAARTLGDLIDARMAEIIAGLDELGARIAGDGDVGARAHRAGVGHGFAAIESPRGRLYHQARFGVDGRVADWRILSPTDWNFHSHGPFATTLAGAALGVGRAAELRVARLAALFDPCVALRARVREAGDA
jgi:hypothetical protein